VESTVDLHHDIGDLLRETGLRRLSRLRLARLLRGESDRQGDENTGRGSELGRQRQHAALREKSLLAPQMISSVALAYTVEISSVSSKV
jgi:hypothetical protein